MGRVGIATGIVALLLGLGALPPAEAAFERGALRVLEDGAILGDCDQFDFLGFGAMSLTDGTCLIPAPPDPYNGVVGDEAGELYLLQDPMLVLGGFGDAIPTSVWNNVPVIIPLSSSSTLLKVCCLIDSGAMTFNFERQDGTPADMLSSDLVCSTAMNADTGVGCTETFVTAEQAIAVGEYARLAITGTPTATRANIVWVRAGLSP